MQICFFEDNKSDNFLPLTLTRPVDQLRIGIHTIADKWKFHLQPARTVRLTRLELDHVFPSTNLEINEPTLWINSRALPNYDIIQRIQQLKVGEGIASKGELVTALIDSEITKNHLEKRLTPKFHELVQSQELPIVLLSQFNDLLQLNRIEIENDCKLFNYNSLVSSKFVTSCISSNPDQIFIAEDAIIEPGVILSAVDGPIFLGAKCRIESGAIIKGPVAICDQSVVKMGARISDGTTIGPVCKIGGEIMNTIFHSYSNKAHEGFMGNSIIGQWCNFGADTNTSNLKNNYSPVRLTQWTRDEHYEVGQFFGSVFGDHSKTSINTMLNTGTICGVSSNIFTSVFPPKVIRSFKWIGDNSNEIYDFDKAVLAITAMAKRRNIVFSEEYITLMRSIYESEHSSSS